MKTWFILSNEKINGPFNAENIISELSDGKWLDSQFWSKGKSHWMTPSQFKEEILKQKKQSEEHNSGTQLWYLKDHNQGYDPLTYEDLLCFLMKKKSYKGILISNNSSDGWQEVYQIESLMDKLGVNRRLHHRVPIEGSVSIIDGFLKGKKAPLATLSQEGLGIKDLKGLSIGEKIKGVFSGFNIQTPIHFQGEIVFVDPNGGFGLKFTNISIEGTSQIIAYVKQFVESHPDVDFLKIA